MPPRKDYGSASRSSSRLIEKPKKQSKPEDASASSEPRERQQQPLNTEPRSPFIIDTAPKSQSPKIEDNVIPSIEDYESDSYELALDTPEGFLDQPIPKPPVAPATAIMASAISPEQLAQLLALLPNSRGVTPENSAFGGTAFKPSGLAAKAAFKPYGADELSVNPSYDAKAKRCGINPNIFDGKKEDFDDWVITVADKLIEDDATFRTERSRMAVVNALTSGLAKELLSTRYSSDDHPYTGVAEMIATLSAVYHNTNQAGDAREKLRHMMFKPGKEMDINQFISKVNTLCSKANIPFSERKTVLFEHIPPYLNPQLLTDSKDLFISYETFCSRVADAAKIQEMTYNLYRERKKANNKQSPPPKRTKVIKDFRETKDHFQINPNDKPKEDLKKEGRCFVCKKEGHIAKSCPERQQMNAALKKLDEEDQEGVDTPSTSSSDSEN